jgi:hypothetical protein
MMWLATKTPHPGPLPAKPGRGRKGRAEESLDAADFDQAFFFGRALGNFDFHFFVGVGDLGVGERGLSSLVQLDERHFYIHGRHDMLWTSFNPAFSPFRYDA